MEVRGESYASVDLPPGETARVPTGGCVLPRDCLARCVQYKILQLQSEMEPRISGAQPRRCAVPGRVTVMSLCGSWCYFGTWTYEKKSTNISLHKY